MPEDKGLSRAEREEQVLKFWKENKIFEKTLEKESPKGEFVFYEGPPTANGLPGIHHLEARAFKDAIPRYKTMRGYHVARQAGWDTHGLPVELEVEKTLGLKSKKEIEEYGIEKFNEECKKSVLKYIGEWTKFTDRIGYWVDFDKAYFTFLSAYIEKVWGVVAKAEERKLLYKDYKVVPWCPRCGTALSSHELAQGYQDVKDISLYVKFKLKDFPNAYFLAWTTTPWTLPGNVALAVGPDITYVEAKVGEEIYVLAKDRLSILDKEYEIVAEHKGSEMVEMQYEPLYDFGPKNDNSHRIYSADFVTTEDGTGIVHTAVMYGQEDFALGTKEGLPKVHLVGSDAKFLPETDWLAGKSVVEESTAVEILKDLQNRNLLYKKESYTHSYPFCWRCKTRLIYYARDSWYIKMSALREDLVEENRDINWEPGHIKDGRFGEWLKEVKDWAISRERYWGTPLPIWEAEDGERIVASSLEDLKRLTRPANNKYIVMRHGESTHNLTWSISTKAENTDTLTEKGVEQVRESAEKLKGKGVDLLIISPFLRTRDTAKIVAEVLELKEDQVVMDDRLHEFAVYSFEGKTWKEYHEAFPKTKEFYDKHNEGDECYKDVKIRMMQVLEDCERKFEGKTILFITHGGPAWLLTAGAGFYSPERMYKMIKDQEGNLHLDDMKNADWREIDYVPLPHNRGYDLDLHRPYIDEVRLYKEGKEFKRVKEVMDVWFDSGSMPFASGASGYPADFISEAIDQTRGWFYVMHAIGSIMEKGKAYRNVICLGHLMDKEGKKMSKSVGNVVNPLEQIEKYGVDALRFWMYSVNQPGDSKNYDERTVDEINKRVFNLVDNIYAFYELYRDKDLEVNDVSLEGAHILDRWILWRLGLLIELMTSKLDEYKLLEPTRALRDFVDDLSTWYLRRSRERIKDGDKDAKQTLYMVMKNLSKLMAPFTPFYAEELWQKLRNDQNAPSVHLVDWPNVKTQGDDKILERMEEVRKIVSLALEERSRANLKVRQPLSLLKIKTHLPPEYIEIIQDELNVKRVEIDENLDKETQLDTTLTPELEEEGKVRDIIREIQDLRKEKGLKPTDLLEFSSKENKELCEKYREQIEKATNTKIV